jgi:hypothetical protein
MNSLLFRAQYMRFWLRLRLRDILLTSELVVRNGNSIREQYIPLTIEISVFTTFKSSEGYIAKPEAEQSNTYTASKKS